MSSRNESRALSPKRQKSAALKNDEECASFLSFEDDETFFPGPDELEIPVKDSQDDRSGFHQGGLQDSSDCIRPVVVDVSRKQRQGDDNGHYHWGKQSQCCPTDSRESSPESLGKETGNVSLSHQLQELTGKTAASYAHALLRFPNEEYTTEPSGIPLALRLQELVQQAQGPGSPTCLPQPQLRVHKRTRELSNSDVHEWATLQDSESSLESGGIPLALRLQKLIQQAPATAPSASVPHPQSRVKQVERRQPIHRKKSASGLTNDWSAIEDDIVENCTQWKKSASSTETDRSIEDDIVENFDTPGKNSASSTKNDRPAIEDDILETFGSSSDLQTQSAVRSASGAPAIPTYLLWERFQEALGAAPLLDTIPTSTDHLNSNQAPSGFSERLQNALKKLKSQQTLFQKSLASNESLHGLSRCLLVLISGKRLEAQLTTCQCKILQSPPEWNDCSHAAVTAVESLDDLPIIEVIFSSKMSGDLELEVGSVVRVYPPWQEIHGAGKFGKIILSTFFCEMVP